MTQRGRRGEEPFNDNREATAIHLTNRSFFIPIFPPPSPGHSGHGSAWILARIKVFVMEINGHSILFGFPDNNASPSFSVFLASSPHSVPVPHEGSTRLPDDNHCVCHGAPSLVVYLCSRFIQDESSSAAWFVHTTGNGNVLLLYSHSLLRGIGSRSAMRDSRPARLG